MSARNAFIPEGNIALFLDVDGTLLEIAATPGAVKVSGALLNTLQLAAEREAGALALVSGRSLAELDRLFAPQVFPAAGQHGLEMRHSDGRIESPALETGSLEAARSVLARLQSSREGLLLEDKGVALAMHYRLAPRLEALVVSTMRALAKDLRETYVLRPGKFVLELAPRGFSKRIAIEHFMREQPFIGRTPVYLGDDVTDEDGFEAVNALGGCSIRVGGMETTAARHRFSCVSTVISWLRERNLNRCPAAYAGR